MWKGTLEMTIKDAEQAFLHYTDRYRQYGNKVLLKISHTLRVRDLCLEIADAPKDRPLAALCGLLHDIGRFEQWRRYGTYHDLRSVDHGDLGRTLLEEDPCLKTFLDPLSPEDRDIVLAAVKYHNKYSIPDKLTDREKHFVRITRDADKIDILNLYLTGELVQHTRNTVMTPKILETLMDRKPVRRSDVVTKADELAVRFGFIFDLNFPKSLEIVREKDLIRRLIGTLAEDETAPELKEQLSHLLGTVLRPAVPETKIALWGYGTYGKCMEQLLSRDEAGPYRITALFDRNHASFGLSESSGQKILDPALSKDLYREGMFEAMLVTIYDPAERQKIISRLKENGVPVLSIDDETPMLPADSFETWEPPRKLAEQGYTKYVFRDQYLEILKHNGFPFVFGKNGVLNGAYWHRYQRGFDLSTRLYRPDLKNPVTELPGEWCLLSGLFGKNYWHFTFESLDRFFVMEQDGYRGRYLAYRTAFSEELFALAGTDLSRITWLDSLSTGTNYHFERLVCPVVPDNSYHLAAPVLLKAAAAVRKNLPPLSHTFPERIFVKRIGTRKLLIEPELLLQYGFETIVPEELSVAEQIRYFEQAKIVLCPHGANTANSLYMQPGSVLIETFPNSYINPLCLDTLVLQGVYYLPLTQRKEPSMEQTDGLYNDYDIDPNLLKLAMAAAEKCQDQPLCSGFLTHTGGYSM